MFDLNECRANLWNQLLVDIEKSDFNSAKTTHEKLFSLERFWSFPGKEVLDKIQEYLVKSQMQLSSSLVSNVLRKLDEPSRRYFRPYGGNLEQLDTIKYNNSGSHLEKKKKNKLKKPCFEILIFHPDPYNHYYLYYNSLNGQQSERDEYYYDIIFANNLADAALALATNHNIQACVSLSGCLSKSSFQDSNKWLESLLSLEEITDLSPSVDNALILKEISNFLRPEVENYYISEVEFSVLNEKYFNSFNKVFYHILPFKDLHYYLLNGVRKRFNTPFYNSLYSYSQKPKTVFHALPVSQGGSIKNSLWTKDFYEFYGENIFDAETSSTQRGLDSLLNPKGPIKNAQITAAKTFGSDKTFFVTNGTSTSNKIVMQANLTPDDIVFISSDCHKSVPYGVVLSGASVIFLQTNAVEKYDLYGAIPLEQIKLRMLELKEIGELYRLKQIVLTNCTFDGLTYDVEKYMMEILAIKPDIIFHWDEAWFAHGHFHPIYKNRHAMGVTRKLQARFQSPEYISEYKKCDCKESMPDPEKVKLRVYATQSTHKTLSSFRQGSMIHVIDEQFNEDSFLDAFYTHTSTSPNYQILASLDIARRQVALEGYSLVSKSIELASWLKKHLINNPKVSALFRVLISEDIFPEKTNHKDVKINECEILNEVINYQQEGMLVDPTRVTLDISETGLTGSQFRKLLINRYNIQVNKTSRHTVLFIINIAATRKSVEYLYRTLAEMADLIINKKTDELVVESSSMPQNRKYHGRYLPYKHTMIASLRKAYYDAYKNENIEYLTVNKENLEKSKNGELWVSALFVTPYPPGFPLLVPGQVIDYEMLSYISSIINDEIHGFDKELGLKILKDTNDITKN
jgi:arginine decarboxylase